MKQQFSGFSGRLLAVFLLFAGTTFLVAAQPEAKRDDSAKNIGEGEDYQYFDLACSTGAWGGYFSPERWDKLPSDTSLALTDEREDALVISFDASRRQASVWSIEIPAAGYLSFLLNVLPPTNKSTVVISVNGEETNFQVRSDGLYYSPFLQRGDRFSLRIPVDSSAYEWTKLVFHSNFNAVIVRPEEIAAADRFTPILDGNIQRVFFPSDAPGTWPVFDQDGDRETTDDQLELRYTDERFVIEYVDNELFESNSCFLERTFTIRETCSRANWLRRSRKWAPLPIIADEAGR
mgnify:CR=1 FL=1